MPVPIAPFVGFVLGVAFAWSATGSPGRARGAPSLAHALAIVALFVVGLFVPACAYFVVFEEDWAWMYVVDPRKVPSAVELALVLADAASVFLGFGTALASARRRRLVAVLATAAPAAALAVAIAGWGAPRLAIVASWAQYHGQFGTRAVAGSTLGWALLWMDGLVAAGAAFTAHQLRVRTDAAAVGTLSD